MMREKVEIKKMIQKAAAVRENAYTPYSGFKVGAALKSKTGKVYTGCNVENASYGATICAERGAVLAANAAGERDFEYIVVVTKADPPAVPCALCLQVLSEFCSPDFEIITATPDGTFSTTTLGDLLPHPFNEVPS